MNLSILGAGYVGLSNAVLLAKKNNVNLIEINTKKAELISKGISPIEDELLGIELKKYIKNIKVFQEINSEVIKSSYILICLPTNFDNKKKCFDTSIIEKTVSYLSDQGYKGTVIIRSTIPVGMTKKLQHIAKKQYDIAFFPEFLREGNALHDSYYPSRIICGSKSKTAKKFLKILVESSKKKSTQTLITNASEAEAIKLFSNTYLALRISFFNELDSFSLGNNLNTKAIIDGLSMDSRIGNHYNNPSFGYGGYCLPKDTKQLKSNFEDIPEKMITATISSNSQRMKFILSKLTKSKESKIGFYRLSMKAGSDNWRESSTLYLLKELKKTNKKLFLYEPMIHENRFLDIPVIKDLKEFKEKCGMIVANRVTSEIKKFKGEIFTRDIFGVN